MTPRTKPRSEAGIKGLTEEKIQQKGNQQQGRKPAAAQQQQQLTNENVEEKIKVTIKEMRPKAAVKCCTARQKTNLMKSKEEQMMRSEGSRPVPASKALQREKRVTAGRTEPRG